MATRLRQMILFRSFTAVVEAIAGVADGAAETVDAAAAAAVLEGADDCDAFSAGSAQAIPTNPTRPIIAASPATVRIIFPRSHKEKSGAQCGVDAKESQSTNARVTAS